MAGFAPSRTTRSAQFRPARGVGEHGMFHHVLMDGLDERIVAHGLHEDRTIVVTRRGGHIDLKREASIALEHPVVDVLDGAEPRHLRIVNVMRFVVEDGEFIDFADDFTEVPSQQPDHLAARRGGGRLGYEPEISFNHGAGRKSKRVASHVARRSSWRAPRENQYGCWKRLR